MTYEEFLERCREYNVSEISITEDQWGIDTGFYVDDIVNEIPKTKTPKFLTIYRVMELPYCDKRSLAGNIVLSRSEIRNIAKYGNILWLAPVDGKSIPNLYDCNYQKFEKSIGFSSPLYEAYKSGVSLLDIMSDTNISTVMDDATVFVGEPYNETVCFLPEEYNTNTEFIPGMVVRDKNDGTAYTVVDIPYIDTRYVGNKTKFSWYEFLQLVQYGNRMMLKRIDAYPDDRWMISHYKNFEKYDLKSMIIGKEEWWEDYDVC